MIATLVAFVAIDAGAVLTLLALFSSESAAPTLSVVAGLLALLGIVLNYAPYRFTGFVARRAVRSEEDVVATAKMLCAALAFPLTWVALAVAGYFVRGPALAVALLVGAPALGYLALVVQERLAEAAASMRAMWAWFRRRAAFVGLLEEQRTLRELLSHAGELAEPDQ